MAALTHSLFDRKMMAIAARDAFRKLSPRHMLRNPVMFVVLVGSLLTTLSLVHDIATGRGSIGFTLQITLWLWFTVLFANFAEAMAEGRGKAQADSLRKSRQEMMAKRLANPDDHYSSQLVPAARLRAGDYVICYADNVIPGDGEVVEGVASVDESAITGESAPVVRESGGDRSAVTGGTKVLSDWLVIRITANPGETFIDRMIALVEGASRQKTPNEIALTILLSALTIIFLLAMMSMKAYGLYSGVDFTIAVLVALLVCLIPTTIGGLLSAIGIAGIDRLVQKNVLAMSGRSVEAAGDVDVLLLDKTGTITIGNRQATEFRPAPGVTKQEVADAAQLASLADETPEGRSIVVLAKEFGIRGRELHEFPHATFVPFTAQTRMSGVDLEDIRYRKGAADAIAAFVGGKIPESVQADVKDISQLGGTPLLVATTKQVLGTIYLKDIVKGGLADRFERFRPR